MQTVNRLLRASVLVSIFAWSWAVAVALLDRRAARSLDDAAPRRRGSDVSVIVPARNEQGRIGRTVRHLAAQQYDPLEIVVVNDESEDATLAEAREAASPRVIVVDGKPVPSGWVGKNWAAHQGVRIADSEWLLFTDADVVHRDDSVARAVALAEEQEIRGLTALCSLVTGSPAERIVQPAAAILIRAFVAPGPLVRSPRSSVAIAAGGYLLLHRDLYEKIGGHAAIRDSVVDDMDLARRAKALGEPVEIVDGTHHASVRMYDGLGETWRGWRKNTSIGLGGGQVALAIPLALLGLLVHLAPAVALVRGQRRLGAVAVLLQTAARVAADDIAPTPRRYWLTQPLGGLFLCAVSVASSLDRLRGGITWRGRRYDRT